MLSFPVCARLVVAYARFCHEAKEVVRARNGYQS